MKIPSVSTTETHLHSHDSVCFDMKHFVDTSKVPSSNFTHVFQVFSCKIIDLETNQDKSTQPDILTTANICFEYQFRRYLKFSW